MMASLLLGVLLLVGTPKDLEQPPRPVPQGSTPTTTTIAVKLLSASPTPSNPLDTAEKILKIIAYLVGGAWVYFNYFRGRTYHARLEPHVTVELCRRSTPEFIKAVAILKNVGLSRVPLRRDGTALRFFVFDSAAPDQWRQTTTVDVFARHEWVEPGETIEDHVLLPSDLQTVAAVRAHLLIGSKPSLWSRKSMWSAIAVAT